MESDAVEIARFRLWYRAWVMSDDLNVANYMTDFNEDMCDTYYPDDEEEVMVAQEDEGLLDGRSEGAERNSFKVRADLKQ